MHLIELGDGVNFSTWFERSKRLKELACGSICLYLSSWQTLQIPSANEEGPTIRYTTCQYLIIRRHLGTGAAIAYSGINLSTLPSGDHLARLQRLLCAMGIGPAAVRYSPMNCCDILTLPRLNAIYRMLLMENWAQFKPSISFRRHQLPPKRLLSGVPIRRNGLLCLPV